MIKISFICSDFSHPVYPVLVDWIKQQHQRYDIQLVESAKLLREQGDFLFLVSCSELISSSVTARFSHALLLHASDLPNGRGWSPHIWEVINGANFITLTLLEVEDSVDTGRIWCQKRIEISRNDLYDEINQKLFAAEIELIEKSITQWDEIIPQVQDDSKSTHYYKKRTPEDSRMDISDSLENQFNLLRVCDPDRFPAFFEYNGQRYTLKLEKVGFTDNEQ
ncbi:MAG: UDP-glucuronic acid dehydrogenase [Pseudomonadales bacterium]|nr:UDP-glucuronic acid dehydrogenase [Pseudomonadales bacterium]NRA17333.1 UDP-glucuronic acid dehydrogenase [Oceanospirillaceae bacterium]